MKTENQLAYVRDTLEKMPRNDWVKVAVAADVVLGTVYNVMKPEGRPGYDVVYQIYDALKNKRHVQRAAK